MYRIGDQSSKELVRLVINRYCVWCVWLALVRNDKTTADPIVNDPKADTIPVADFTDIERVVGQLGRWDTVFIS
jgi:hypothetical protein